LHGPLRLLLHDYCPSCNSAAVRDIAQAQLNEVARTELAVDSQIE
jgi:hypothetical protein